MKATALLLCAGCAGSAYVARPRPGAVIAEGVRHGEGSFEGTRGVKLFE